MFTNTCIKRFMKTIDLALTPEEAYALNNILVENCMSMVEVVNAQPNAEQAAKAMQLLRISQTGQQYLFDNIQKGATDFSENVCQFYRHVVAAARAAMDEAKKGATEKGQLDNVFQIGTLIERLDSILKKIPEESRIIV